MLTKSLTKQVLVWKNGFSADIYLNDIYSIDQKHNILFFVSFFMDRKQNSIYAAALQCNSLNTNNNNLKKKLHFQLQYTVQAQFNGGKL